MYACKHSLFVAACVYEDDRPAFGVRGLPISLSKSLERASYALMEGQFRAFHSVVTASPICASQPFVRGQRE